MDDVFIGKRGVLLESRLGHLFFPRKLASLWRSNIPGLQSEACHFPVVSITSLKEVFSGGNSDKILSEFR